MSRAILRMRVALLLAFATLGGCSEQEATVRRQPPPEETGDLPEAPVFDPQRGASAGTAGAYEVITAGHDDSIFEGDDLVDAIRVVYRVRLMVPRVLGVVPETVPRPASELTCDLTEERLRARFVGDGWPVPSGAEVRIRSDFPGAYAFDSRGGRPLSPGFLAEWFQGGPVGEEHRPTVRIRPDTAPSEVPGVLVCSLLAELAGQDRAALERRCGTRGAPVNFRVGHWVGERTAELPVQVALSALRADHLDPPERVVDEGWRYHLPPSALSRIVPPVPPRRALAEGPIVVENRLAVRAVITAQGAPIGWVDPSATATFEGVTPGRYLVAGMRPLGTVAWRPREMRLPARITLR